MDSLSQIVLGGAVAAAIAPMGHRRAALLAGAALGTLPDLDSFLIKPFVSDPVMLMTMHRSFSHSLLVLPLVGALIWWLCRRREGRVHAAPVRWFWAIQLALITHPLLDAFTVYGTQLWWPLTPPPTMWSSVFIIDPLYTIWLLIACVLAWVVPKKPLAQRALLTGLVLSSGYLGWSLLAKSIVDRQAEPQLRAMGLGASPRFSTPMPFNTLLWRVVAMTPSGYVEAERSVFDRGPMVFRGHASNTQALAQADAAGIPAVRRLMWFNRGFMRAQVANRQLTLSDLRMGLDPDYSFNFTVAQASDDSWQAMRNQQVAAPLPISGSAGFSTLMAATWDRIWNDTDEALREVVVRRVDAQAAAGNPAGAPATKASK
jgi:inner membrane protein